MGKWNNRWIPNSRRYNGHENRGRFQPERPPPYPAEAIGNSVPEWEKQFCYAVGSVPWRKILSTKTFASCYPDVMDWDDSEAKDTFHAAKRRFWAQINGFRTDDVPFPDPNAYIDQIDWNASIDTDLYKDLDRALLSADADMKQETEVSASGIVDISALKSRWQEWHHGTAEDVWDSGGGWDTSNTGAWGAVNNAIQDKVDADPWDCVPIKSNGPVNNTSTWGDCNDKSLGWQREHSTINGNFQCHGAKKDNQWALPGNNTWGRNQQPNNFKETNSWTNNGSIQHNSASSAREWGNHGNQPQFRNSWNNNQHKKTDTFYRSSQNQDWGNRGDRKRESPTTYAPRSKSPRFQRRDNQRHAQYEAVQPWRNKLSVQQAGSSSFRPS